MMAELSKANEMIKGIFKEDVDGKAAAEAFWDETCVDHHASTR